MVFIPTKSKILKTKIKEYREKYLARKSSILVDFLAANGWTVSCAHVHYQLDSSVVSRPVAVTVVVLVAPLVVAEGAVVVKWNGLMMAIARAFVSVLL